MAAQVPAMQVVNLLFSDAGFPDGIYTNIYATNDRSPTSSHTPPYGVSP